jgi:hypothetical protein
MDSSESLIFIVPMGIGSVALLGLTNQGDLFDNSDSELTTNISFVMYLLWCLMYFVFDLVLISLYENNRKNLIYMVHHGIGICSILLVFMYFYPWVKYLVAYMSFELSTPLLYISTYFHQSGINNTLSKILNIAFVAIFLIVRIFFGTYLLYMVLYVIINMGSYCICLSILPITLQCFNYYWFYKIILMFRKKFDKSHAQ